MKRSILVLAVLVLFGAACGVDAEVDGAVVNDGIDDVAGDDGNGADSNGDDSSGDDGNGADSSGDDDGSDDDDSNEDVNDPAPTATSAPPPPTEVPDSPDVSFADSDDWCVIAQAVEDRFDELDLVGFADPEALRTAYGESLAIVRRAQRFSPPEISAAVATSIVGLEFFTAELEKVEWKFLDLDLAALDSIGDEQDQATFEIDRYNFEVCNIANDFDPTDDPSLSIDQPDTEVPVTGTIRDQATAGLVSAGFTPTEAACIIDQLDLTNPAAFGDPSVLIPVFESCGIPLERLAQLGG